MSEPDLSTSSGARTDTHGRSSETIASIVRSRLTRIVAVGAAVTSVLAAAPAAQAKPGRHGLNGSRPNWLAEAKATGSAPASASTIHFGVLLKLRDAAGAAATLASLSNP